MNMIEGIGSIRFMNLIRKFETAENVFKAGEKEIRGVEGITEKIAKRIVAAKTKNGIKSVMEKLKKHKAETLTINDPEYPELLSSIYDPPPVLYVRGKIEKRDRIAIALVGSRVASYYGKSVSEKLAFELSKMGVTIVSGLARGIDTSAHRSALKSGGRTIGVLGSGINVPYPKENANLMDEMAERGAVVTEFPVDAEPDKFNFPLRNRIISGLSLGTVVVEAAKRSGSLITADCALEQNREVFAVPGNVTQKNSEGANRLIKNGAKLVENADDIVEEIAMLSGEIGLLDRQEKPRPEMNKDEEVIYGIISDEPQYIDEFVRKSGMPVQKVSALLMNLELKQAVKQIQGKLYVRT